MENFNPHNVIPFKVGDTVLHRKYGTGEIVEVFEAPQAVRHPFKYCVRFDDKLPEGVFKRQMECATKAERWIRLSHLKCKAQLAEEKNELLVKRASIELIQGDVPQKSP